MKVEKLVYGIYPKTNELRLHIGRWEKGRIPDASLNTEIESEKRLFYGTLNENSIEHTDPLFNWYDILRPICLITDGIDLGSLSRFKETNSFYRMPVINYVGGITIDPADFFPLNENPPLPLYLPDGNHFSAFLPSPLSFYKMSRTTLSYDKFQEGLEKLYMEMLGQLKLSKVVIYDPIPYREEDVLDLSALSKFQIRLVTTGKLYPGNIKGKVYSIISDYTSENFEISRLNSAVPGVKLIDGYSTKMENVADINKVIDSLDTDRLIVSHSEYFDFLPRIIADRKIDLISRIGE
jgi:5-methyltetrahydropteroyltriglutamate--homocysteine methyltransferase